MLLYPSDWFIFQLNLKFAYLVSAIAAQWGLWTRIAMVYKIKPNEAPLFYEEITKVERKRRYCLRNIKLIETKAAKDENSINILFSR